MDRTGRWQLAPAFDVTYSYNLAGEWTSSQQMSMNGKRDGFTLEDFIVAEKGAILKRGRSRAIMQEVMDAVRAWPECAAAAGVPEETAARIGKTFRTIT